MNPKQEYRFDDFTETRYREILRITREHYSFERFGTPADLPHVLWRHDVDMSVHRARRLAQIEADEGVTSTYFFLLQSEYYNLFEPTVHKLAREITDLGHAVGLHFDLAIDHADADSDALVSRLAFERKILESLLNTEIDVFSFHNPDFSNALQLGQTRIGGLINAYGSDLRERYSYVSDSNGYWRFRNLREVVTERKMPKLHVLTHPTWWTPDVLSPRQRVARAIDGRASNAHAAYDAVLDVLGRVNVR